MVINMWFSFAKFVANLRRKYGKSEAFDIDFQ